MKTLTQTTTDQLFNLSLTCCGVYAGEFLYEAWDIINGHEDIPECEGNMWADIMYDRDGRVYAIWADGELTSFGGKALYIELEYSDSAVISRAFEGMWEKEYIDTSEFDQDFNPSNPNYSELYENEHCRLDAIKVKNRTLFRVYYKNDPHQISNDFWDKIEMDEIFINVPDDATGEDFGMQYVPAGANITLDEKYFIIDLNTGLGKEFYPRTDFTIQEAIDTCLSPEKYN